MKRRRSLVALAICLSLALSLWPVAAQAADPVTLNLDDGAVCLDPAGYTQGGVRVEYAGPYVLVGSTTSDSPLLLRNETGAPVSFDVTLDGATLRGDQTAAVRAEGNAAIALNLASRGQSALTGGGQPALTASVSLTAVLSVTAGSLALSSQGGSAQLYGDGVALQLASGTGEDGGLPLSNSQAALLVPAHRYVSDGAGSHTCADCAKTLDCVSDGQAVYLNAARHATTCRVCGGPAEQPARHDVEGPVSYADEDGHVLTCSACGAESEFLNHAGDFDPEGPIDDSAHTLRCTVCGETYTQAHQIAQTGSVHTPPTQTDWGVYRTVCTVCNYAVDAPIAPTGGYWVRLYESYGDGWNDAQILVFSDGTEVQRLTVTDNNRYQQDFFVPANPESALVFVFQSGDYDGECGVTLYAPGQHTPCYTRSSLSNVRTGDVLFAVGLADYSGVKAALAEIPEDLGGYTLESIAALDAAVHAVQWYLSDQATVDGYAAAIRAATAGLAEDTNNADQPAAELTLRDGDVLAITQTGYSLNGGGETPHAGPYVLRGQAHGAQIQVESGSHAITLQDLKVTQDTTTPFVIRPGARAVVTLQGDNLLDAYNTDMNEQAGLNVPEGAHLLLYGPGSLNARGGPDSAGIGGNAGQSAGNITIYGGDITALSNDDGAGIGGGYEGGAGRIVIYGGVIHAECEDNDGAGIGCGDDGNGGVIIIHGGDITALSLDDDGAGIGGADEGKPDSILITGGTIVARSDEGAGIGGGDETDGGVITVTGGVITVSSVLGAGIGGGSGEGAGRITLTGGVIVVEDYARHIIGGDAVTSEDADNFVTIDGASIFSDQPNAISPAPKDRNGRRVYALELTTDREDGYASVTLEDGSLYLAHVLNGQICLYVPLQDAAGVVGDPNADYAAVDAALARVPQDLSPYTADSVAALQAAIDDVERGLYVDRQADVDAMAAALEAALAGLTLSATPTPLPTVAPTADPSATPAPQRADGSPGTGDDGFARVLPYALALAVAAVALVAVLLAWRKRRRG